MRSKLLLIFTSVLSLLSVAGYAQTRYMDSVFAGYTVTTVTYSTVFGQQMDIYQPAGDTATHRPVIVLAHGGSFTSGDRTDDSTIVWLCHDLTHKGYVTVSIDYRLTSDLNLVYPTNGDSAISEVLEAVSDGKAAVRYIHEYADSFGIDTGNIFIGGNSAGAVLFMQYAYIDSLSELPANFIPILPVIGGTLDGNSGNPGYSTNFKGVVSLAGGINQVAWLGYCSKPIVMAQGTADDIVPYTCGNPEAGAVQVTLCGLGSLAPNIVANTPYYDTMTFPGAGHVPWQSGGIDFYMVDTLITGFLYKEVTNAVPASCPVIPAGIQTVANTDITLYPNPASNVLNIQSSDLIRNVSLTDETGRVISQVSDINTLSYQLNTSGISAGIYFVRINDDADGDTPTVRKVIIE